MTAPSWKASSLSRSRGFLEGGTLLSIGEDGQEERTTWVYKDVWFLPRGQAHTVEVVGGLPRMMLYELK